MHSTTRDFEGTDGAFGRRFIRPRFICRRKVSTELSVLLFNRTCPDDACPVYFVGTTTSVCNAFRTPAYRLVNVQKCFPVTGVVIARGSVSNPMTSASRGAYRISRSDSSERP